MLRDLIGAMRSWMNCHEQFCNRTSNFGGKCRTIQRAQVDKITGLVGEGVFTLTSLMVSLHQHLLLEFQNYGRQKVG